MKQIHKEKIGFFPQVTKHIYLKVKRALKKN